MIIFFYYFYFRYYNKIKKGKYMYNAEKGIFLKIFCNNPIL